MSSSIAEVAGRVADALDAGLIPWRLPSFPRNVLSGGLYNGVDPILLKLAADKLESSSPWWGTAKKWQAVGGGVRKDSSGARILGCSQVVYNFAETDRSYEPPRLTHVDPDEVFDAIIHNGAVNIEYVFNTTCMYYGAEDKIRMPHRLMFEIGPGGTAGYYDALGHELFHWSERRMAWDAHPDVSELRAEIGTGFLGALVGAKPLPLLLARHHRKYAAGWAKLMRSQPNLLVKVCENVTATVSWLLAFAGSKVDWACLLD